MPSGRRRSAAFGTIAVLVLAGLLFSTSATVARGTSLRTDQVDAAALALQEQDRFAQRQALVSALQKEVEARTATFATVNGRVALLQQQAAPLALTAGLAPVSGPGYQVELDDAPHTGALPAGVRPDDLVVHQQDVQAVVNALWSGGAEAMMLMDQRVIATSAVRCVGNTLILQGRVYSPPYRITAIGDVAGMQRALDRSAAVILYRQYVSVLKLGWSAGTVGAKTFPGYAGSTELTYAKPVPAP